MNFIRIVFFLQKFIKNIIIIKEEDVILSVENYNLEGVSSHFPPFRPDDIENDPTYHGIICKIFIKRTNSYNEFM